MKRLFDREVDVHEFIYEETLSGAKNEEGCVALVGFKDMSGVAQAQEIQALHERDFA
jgi:hypothetical protein